MRYAVTKPKQLKAKDLKKFRSFVLKKQKGKCLICGNKPKRPCLDHSHKKRIKGTGLVRGVVCSNCNIMIAKAENNCTRYGFSQEVLPQILRSIANYLERPHLPYVHPSEAPPKKKLTKKSYNHMARILKEKGYKVPEYSKSGTLTKPLEKAFKQADLEPEFYK